MGLGPWYSFSSLSKTTPDEPAPPKDEATVEQPIQAPVWPPVMNETTAWEAPRVVAAPVESVNLSVDIPESEPSFSETSALVDEVMQEVESAVSTPLETPALPVVQVTQLRHALQDVQKALTKAIDLLSDMGSGQYHGATAQAQETFRAVSASISKMESEVDGDSRVVEGVFDGQHMQGADGKQYTVPPNYASKSKLVEGDLMKLTITTQGSFIYKQIRPIERVRIIAKLDQHPETREFIAILEDRRWHILTASVTYFRGAPGDEVVIVVPQAGMSRWAAVENIIRKM